MSDLSIYVLKLFLSRSEYMRDSQLENQNAVSIVDIALKRTFQKPVPAVIMIAIGGGSRSGKTTISKRLAEEIKARGIGKVTHLSQDNYFNPIEQPKELHRVYSYKGITGTYWNFDHPSAMDWTLMKTQLTYIRKGESVRPPIYFFGTGGKRCLESAEMIECPDFLIFEGIHALNPEIRHLFDFTVFVDTSREVRYSRTVKAGEERDQSLKDTISYFPIVEEAYENFVLPTREGSLILHGEQDVLVSVETILENISQTQKQALALFPQKKVAAR